MGFFYFYIYISGSPLRRPQSPAQVLLMEVVELREWKGSFPAQPGLGPPHCVLRASKTTHFTPKVNSGIFFPSHFLWLWKIPALRPW